MRAAAVLLKLGAVLVLMFGGALPSRADIAWGVNGHPLVSYSGVSIDEQLDLAQQLGLRSYRVDVYTTEQMDQVAALVEAGQKRGMTILPVLIPSTKLDEQSVVELYEVGFHLASVYVKRFKDAIDVWELGNEMEIYALIRPCELRDDGTIYPCEWGIAGGVGTLDYFGPRYLKVAAVLRGMSDGVRAQSPTARRAIGSAGWGHLGILDRLNNDGIEWEITVWHMYGEDPEPAFKHLSTFGKPIWVTEFNHPFGSQDGESAQADGLVRWMGRLEALSDTYKVEAAHIYELFDEPYWAPSYEAVMGLYGLAPRPEGGWMPSAPKQAFGAVQTFITGKKN